MISVETMVIDHPETMRDFTLFALYLGSPVYLAGALGQVVYFLRRHRAISCWPWLVGCIVLTVAVSLALTVVIWVVPLGLPMWVAGSKHFPALLATAVVAPVLALLFMGLSLQSRDAA